MSKNDDFYAPLEEGKVRGIKKVGYIIFAMAGFALFFVYGLFCWVREKVMRLFGKNEN